MGSNYYTKLSNQLLYKYCIELGKQLQLNRLHSRDKLKSRVQNCLFGERPTTKHCTNYTIILIYICYYTIEGYEEEISRRALPTNLNTHTPSNETQKHSYQDTKLLDQLSPISVPNCKIITVRLYQSQTIWGGNLSGFNFGFKMSDFLLILSSFFKVCQIRVMKL